MLSKRSFKLLVVSSTAPFSVVWQWILSLIVENFDFTTYNFSCTFLYSVQQDCDSVFMTGTIGPRSIELIVRRTFKNLLDCMEWNRLITFLQLEHLLLLKFEQKYYFLREFLFIGLLDFCFIVPYYKSRLFFLRPCLMPCRFSWLFSCLLPFLMTFLLLYRITCRLPSLMTFCMAFA